MGGARRGGETPYLTFAGPRAPLQGVRYTAKKYKSEIINVRRVELVDLGAPSMSHYPPFTVVWTPAAPLKARRGGAGRARTQ